MFELVDKKIKNFDALALTQVRKDVLAIIEQGLEAIDTANIISQFLTLKNNVITIANKQFNIFDFRKIIVCAVGKCALEGAKAIENILGDFITDGIAFYIGEKNINLKKIEKVNGTHPYPSNENINGSKKLVEKLSNLTEKDLVIFLISGGGSALLYLPPKGDAQLETEIFKRLTSQGANILELNTLRKHLSLVRGGFLAKYIYPAKAISLIFSDVIGNDLSFIASGPTVKDTTTVSDALNIIKKYNINDLITDKLELIETPKDDFYFKNILNILAVSNENALNAMESKAKNLGYNVEIVSKSIVGEAREIGIKILNDLRLKPSKTVLLYGGETTVTIKGTGKGGRNQELVLSALRYIPDDVVIAAFGSDGHDNGRYAGALCDKITKESSKNLNLDDFLQNNNSTEFFEKVGDYILTGDTGSNVSDLMIGIKI
ncbi:MAG: glycerate kinase type-2 family protein [Minisyncoccia bacterium]